MTNKFSQSNISQFQNTVWNYYKHNKREMPWRKNLDPYAILVSEFMLQQTQVSRVIPKFLVFMQKFPSVDSLAQAELRDVLASWSGLGYNRRAKLLKQAAQQIVQKHAGKIPNNIQELDALPGIGHATACAICAYAYNQPVAFIETNIRTVFIHHFFANVINVHDNDLLPLVQQSLPQEKSREWYWALMDYGAKIKETHGNLSQKSKHYTKQSKFAGSDRQLRGKILRALLKQETTIAELQKIDADKEKFNRAFAALQQENIITVQKENVSINNS